MSKKQIIFSGRSHPKLAQAIAKKMHLPLGKCVFHDFPDKEMGLQIIEDVKECTVFVIQTIAKHPHKFLFELLLMVDALRRKSAGKIIAVIPYFGYARQDRRNLDGEPISARMVADIIQNVGVDHLITMDLHTPQVEGFFKIAVDHLHGRSVFVEKLKKISMQKPAVVSPDIGSKQLARNMAQELKWDIAIIDKRRIDERTTKAMALIGDVAGKDVVIVDDICSTGNTLLQAVDLLKKQGAAKIYIAVSHFLSEKTESFFTDRGIEKVFITDSVENEKKDLNIEIISIDSLFADAMKKFE